MDRRSIYPYPLRSKPLLNYDSDVAVLASDDSDNNNNANDNDNDNDEDYRGHRFRHQIPTRHPRKHRKISTLNYHFTPPPITPTPTWSEQGTFVLLDIWGDRFLQLGRSSLRSEDWADVAERVSQATQSKIDVSDCRNRLNVLKEKYKREKSKWGVLGGGISRWVFYKKMDGLLTMSPRQLQQQEQCGLNCGVDSGEFVFMNPRVYLDHSNGLDEMRDSPGNSEVEDESSGDDESDDDEEAEESYKLLSESIKRVGAIYEKIEDSKRCHMMELEKMRGEFQRELEVQKKAMVDRTSAEIEKLSERGGDRDRGSDCSAENVVG